LITLGKFGTGVIAARWAEIRPGDTTPGLQTMEVGVAGRY
jgi:hypothetical protein